MTRLDSPNTGGEQVFAWRWGIAFLWYEEENRGWGDVESSQQSKPVIQPSKKCITSLYCRMALKSRWFRGTSPTAPTRAQGSMRVHLSRLLDAETTDMWNTILQHLCLIVWLTYRIGNLEPPSTTILHAWLRTRSLIENQCKIKIIR